MSNQGKTVKAHYRGTLDDGTQFDSSYDRGEPIEFVAGAGQMIKGFDVAVLDMEVGEKKTVHIPAAEAYGERSEDMILFFPAAEVPDFDKIQVGMKLFLQGPGGMPVARDGRRGHARRRQARRQPRARRLRPQLRYRARRGRGVSRFSISCRVPDAPALSWGIRFLCRSPSALPPLGYMRACAPAWLGTMKRN